MSTEQTQPEPAPDQQVEHGFEERLQRLEQIVEALEQGSLPLDKSLALYEEGITAYRACQGMLQEAEGKVVKLVQTLEGELRAEPFEAQEDE